MLLGHPKIVAEKGLERAKTKRRELMARAVLFCLSNCRQAKAGFMPGAPKRPGSEAG
jgi:hypothetical protein